jgi:hypothetical protein
LSSDNYISGDCISGDHIGDDYISGDYISDDYISDDCISDDYISNFDQYWTRIWLASDQRFSPLPIAGRAEEDGGILLEWAAIPVRI